MARKAKQAKKRKQVRRAAAKPSRTKTAPRRSRKAPRAAAKKRGMGSEKGGMGKLRSMRVSDGFRALVLDNLSALDEVVPRPMFGGLGLYCRGIFFGIVASDVLYLKADDELRVEFERAGSRAFKPFANRPMSMKYFSVPPAVLEHPLDLMSWAERSLAVARRS